MKQRLEEEVEEEDEEGEDAGDHDQAEEEPTHECVMDATRQDTSVEIVLKKQPTTLHHGQLDFPLSSS